MAVKPLEILSQRRSYTEHCVKVLEMKIDQFLIDNFYLAPIYFEISPETPKEVIDGLVKVYSPDWKVEVKADKIYFSGNPSKSKTAE